MLTNHTSKKSYTMRYLGILPLLGIIMLLFHSPVHQGKARNILPEVEPLVLLGPVSAEEEAPSRFPLPDKFKERISWGFAEEAIHPISKKKTSHMGIDIPAPTGTPVYATAKGKVLKASVEEGWGKLVVLEHAGGFTTFYAHLDEILVQKGDELRKGFTLGKVGNTGQSTGPHLHYEVRKNGQHVNPADYY